MKRKRPKLTLLEVKVQWDHINTAEMTRADIDTALKMLKIQDSTGEQIQEMLHDPIRSEQLLRAVLSVMSVRKAHAARRAARTN